MGFQLNSEQFQAALRAVLAGVIVVLVAQTLRLENTYWSLLTVLILVQPRARATYQKGLYRILGTVLGAGLAIILMSLFAQEPLLLFVSLAASFFVIFYLMSGKLLPYSFLMAAFTLIMVANSGLEAPEQTVVTAIARTTEICLGVAASIFITIWIWPQSAASSLAQTLKGLSSSLRLALGQRFRPEENPGTEFSLEIVRAAALTRLEEITVLADQVILEGSLEQDEQQKLLRACHQWEGLTLALFEWLDTPVDLVRPRLQSGEEEELKQFAADLERILQVLGDDPKSPIEPVRAEMVSVSEKMLIRLAGQRESGFSKQFSVDQNFAYYRILEATKNIATCLEHISLPALRSDAASHLSKDLPAWTRVPELLWADLRHPEPARLPLAIKATGLFLGMLLASQASHLSFMLQSMISALFILSQSTVGSTVHKAVLRLGGALGGGLLALAVLMIFNPWLNSLAFILILLSLVMFFASYVGNGPPAYNYLGIQAGMAFFLTMFSGFAPPLSLDPAITRFTGVIVGSFVAILLTTSIKPAHAGQEFSMHLQRLREQLAKAFQRIRRGKGEAGDALAEIELNDCQKELNQASNYLLHSRIEGMMEADTSRESAAELDQLRRIFHLLKDLNEVPSVLHRLPPDQALTQAVEESMNSIEERLLDPVHAKVMEAKRLTEAIFKARQEGTLVKWDAKDVTAAGASMYLVGQLLSIQGPAAELSPGFQLEPLV